jgi:hypothetical protein
VDGGRNRTCRGLLSLGSSLIFSTGFRVYFCIASRQLYDGSWDPRDCDEISHHRFYHYGLDIEYILDLVRTGGE